MSLERIDVPRPELTERSEPRFHFAEWLGFQPVQTPLRVDRGFHKSSVAQHPQVLGHGRLRHSKLTLDLSDRLFRCHQEAEDRAAVRLGDDLEHRFHTFDILLRVYTCQGI